MKKEMTQKMKENYPYFGGISFIYGLFFTFCLYENFSGITFPLCVAGTLYVCSLFFKKLGIRIKKSGRKYMIGMLLLGVANCYTANGMFLFLDIVAILILLVVFMIEQFYEENTWPILLYIQNMFIAAGTFLAKLFTPFTDGISYLKIGCCWKLQKLEKTKGILLGICVAVPILLVVVPLLIQSDRIFSDLFQSIFGILRPDDWKIGIILGKIVMFFVGVTGCYGVFRGMCTLSLETEQKARKKADPMIGITCNAVISILYLVYSFIQVIYLFIGFESGLPSGVSYASYARSGFFELLAVSLINFVLVLVSDAIFEENKWLKILLFVISGCTFIMIGSSGYRMLLYVKVYHLTFLRVLVLWFLIVLTLFMIGLLIYINRRNFSLFRYIVIVMMCCYIPFVYSRPEAFIANYNLSRDYITWEDIYYVVYSGTYESIPALIDVNPEKLNTWDSETVYESVEVELERQIQSALYDDTGKYQEAEEMDIRKWNYSKYQAKKAAEQYFEEKNERE